MAELDDSQLVTWATDGDNDAFTGIVRRYRSMVYGYCYHRTGSFEDARDLAQDTFIRAYTRLSQIRDAAKLGAWLRTIAANLCNRWIETRREVSSVEVWIEEPRQQPPHAAVVREALANLPENERLAVVLHYVDGYSYGDIAGFLEISKPAVRGRLYRGREMLRTEMLKMTEETFGENRLDEEFVIDSVGAAIQEAADAYNLRRDKGLSRRKTDEAARLLDGPPGRQIRDPVALGNAFMGLATREDVLGEQDRAQRHSDRARALFQQAGDRDGAEALRAGDAYGQLKAGDLAAAHRGFSEAADYWLRRRAEGTQCNDYEYVAAVRALESLGFDTARSSMLSFLCGVSWFVREDAQLLAYEGVAFGFSDKDYPARVGSHQGPPPCPTPLPLVLVRDEPEVGDSLTFVNRDNPRFVSSDGHAEESVLESLTETVTTPAGTFRNCAFTSSRVFASDQCDGEPVASRKLWLAPGVGIVRVTYQDVGEDANTLEMASYSVQRSDDLVPLAVGNWWKWRWIEGEEQHGLRTEYYKGIVEETSNTRFLAAQYWFCVRR